MIELYKKYRPKTLAEVMGQDGAIASIRQLVLSKKIPHAIMLTGPSGTGKTTIARILARLTGCSPNDYHEKDYAIEEKPMDFVRFLRRSVALHPISGPCSVWFLEEFQSLSRAGFSQQALLKILEDTPGHIYFILATTDMDKIHKAIQTRCYEIRLAEIKSPILDKLIQTVAQKEGLKVSEDMRTEIVEAAEGSARKALVILEQIGSLKSEEDQLKAIQTTTVNKDDARTLARLLIGYGGTARPGWSEVAKVLRSLSVADPENTRYCVLGYARACLLGKEGKPSAPRICQRAFTVIDIFSDHFYNSKHAGLAAACWEVITSK